MKRQNHIIYQLNNIEVHSKESQCGPVRIVIFTCVPRLTGTMVVIDQVNASSSMLALPHTVIYVMVTVLSSPAFLALATVVPNQILA
jgi:hypothetical protein